MPPPGDLEHRQVAACLGQGGELRMSLKETGAMISQFWVNLYAVVTSPHRGISTQET